MNSRSEETGTIQRLKSEPSGDGSGEQARNELSKKDWQDVCWPTAWTRVALSIFTKAVCPQITGKREMGATALCYYHNGPWSSFQLSAGNDQK
jgi:hypothetical protein